MKRILLPLVLFALCVPHIVVAQDRAIVLAVDSTLQNSGILKHILPRFSLKTGVAITLKPFENKGIIPGNTDVVLANAPVQVGGTLSVVVMAGGGNTYSVSSAYTRDQDTVMARKSIRFVDWLLSEIGQRTIDSYKGKIAFQGIAGRAVVVADLDFDGNAALGATLSLTNCGRCHVIGDVNRMKGLGSTPSFGLLRTFPDWQQRFEAFFTLRPHPSFSQITDVTEPFDPTRPPPIFPLEISLEQLDNILAYVATIAPADLGAPLQHQ